MNETQSTSSLKTLWQRRDGKPVVIITAALLLSFLYWGMPALIKFATDLLHLAIIGAAGLIIFWTIVDNELRTKLWYLYKSIIRLGFSWFVNLNPEAILKSHIDFLRKQLETFKTQLDILRGHSRALERVMAEQAAESDSYQKLAKKQAATDKLAAANLAGRVTKLSAAIEKNKSLKNKIEMLIKLFERVKKVNEIAIENKEFDINQLIRERKIGGVAVKAIKSSFSILFGNSADRNIYEEAVNKMQDDIAMQRGIFDSFAADTKPILEKFDLEEGILQDEGMKLLQQWDEKLPALLGIQTQVEKSPVFVQNVPVVQDANYLDLITKQS
jgi:hypothetical protein